MSKKVLLYTLTLGCLVAVLAPAAVQAQTCEPLNNGRLANVFHDATALFFEPVVEYRTMTLTIGGPCEDIVKVFGPKDKIFFDLAEIERITDGQYSWELHREASVDPSVQKELQASRGSGEEDALWWSFFQKGLIPEGPYVDSGSFTVVRGQIIDPNSSSEEKSASLAGKDSRGGRSSSVIQATLAGGLGSGDSGEDSGGPVLATKDTVLTNSDGTIRNSLCVGFDCLNDNTYSDTTILLTENNTRIKFDDTSSINSFPRNDWEIEANSNLNGGANYLGFNDCGQSSGGGCASDLVFAVEAGVRQHALYVESDGDVGFGTSNPVLELHTVSGDTPGLRLEQDGSSGFQPQVWDLAGNETSFFVRDASNGSTLPFRIRPGASSNSLVIDSDDDIGIGILSPSTALEVSNSASGSEGRIRVHNTNGTVTDRTLLELVNDNGGSQFFLTSNSIGTTWQFSNTAAGFIASLVGSGGAEFNIKPDGRVQMGPGANVEFELMPNGDLTIGGALTQNSSREDKSGFLPADTRSILDKVNRLPLMSWSYQDNDPSVRHLGPMAEDFHAAFGLGAGDKGISSLDTSGVALAAIQGLSEIVNEIERENQEIVDAMREKDEKIEQLEQQNRALLEALAEVRTLVARDGGE